MENIIELRNLSHIYSAGTPFEKVAINDINLCIKKGEILGIIGATGSGKSTLINHLNGLLKPTSGEIFIDGKNIWSEKYNILDARFKVGLVFQYPEYQLFDETVAKDIAFGPKNMGLDDFEVSKRVAFAMDFVGLENSICDKSPFELSGGQKRRVAIAGVIAMKPDVLVLDEPTAGLDPIGREEILSSIIKYKKETNATIILVTHSMDDIANIANRVVVMKNSNILIDGVDVFTRSKELKSAGLDVPIITQVFDILEEKGYCKNHGVYTMQQGIELIKRLKEGEKC